MPVTLTQTPARPIRGLQARNPPKSASTRRVPATSPPPTNHPSQPGVCRRKKRSFSSYDINPCRVHSGPEKDEGCPPKPPPPPSRRRQAAADPSNLEQPSNPAAVCLLECQRVFLFFLARSTAAPHCAHQRPRAVGSHTKPRRRRRNLHHTQRRLFYCPSKNYRIS